MRVIWVGSAMFIIGAVIALTPFRRMPSFPMHRDHYPEFMVRFADWAVWEHQRGLVGGAIAALGIGMCWAVALHEWGMQL